MNEANEISVAVGLAENRIPMLARRILRTSSLLMSGVRPMCTSVGTRVAHAQAALKGAQAVCFDVDSTVVTSEGIDDLAAYLGCCEKVACARRARGCWPIGGFGTTIAAAASPCSFESL